MLCLCVCELTRMRLLQSACMRAVRVHVCFCVLHSDFVSRRACLVVCWFHVLLFVLACLQRHAHPVSKHLHVCALVRVLAHLCFCAAIRLSELARMCSCVMCMRAPPCGCACVSAKACARCFKAPACVRALVRALAHLCPCALVSDCVSLRACIAVSRLHGCFCLCFRKLTQMRTRCQSTCMCACACASVLLCAAFLLCQLARTRSCMPYARVCVYKGMHMRFKVTRMSVCARTHLCPSALHCDGVSLRAYAAVCCLRALVCLCLRMIRPVRV
jgi:hypothetical protein